jgi:hypothetical protein
VCARTAGSAAFDPHQQSFPLEINIAGGVIETRENKLDQQSEGILSFRQHIREQAPRGNTETLFSYYSISRRRNDLSMSMRRLYVA